MLFKIFEQLLFVGGSLSFSFQSVSTELKSRIRFRVREARGVMDWGGWEEKVGGRGWGGSINGMLMTD